VQRLGGRATWIGRVGDDELGKRVLREIQAEGVDTRAIIDPDAPTGLMLKARRSQIRTQLWYYRSGSAGSRLQAADLDDELLSQARILHLTGITPGLSESARGAAEHACRIAREAGTKISLDLNFRQALWKPTDFSAAIRDLLPFADIVFGSAHECAYIVGDEPDTPAAQAQALAQLGPSQCVIKLGERGAVALADGTVYRRGSYDVPVVDTVGAGDAFVAGWLAEYLRDPSDVTAMLETAVACGAYACTVRGDWEGAPGRDELDQLSQTGETVSR
jgi:2-dehydro-3-deoxygluconokinase